ncbi:MAG: hypothetical protein WEB58_20755 [Planctomycetaceae bacterium]|jgi:hypothetical protein
MNETKDGKNRTCLLWPALLACLLIAGCAWERSYFQFDSNNRLPFFGLEFRWPPTAQVDRPREDADKDVDDDESAAAAKSNRRLTIRAQSLR